MTINELLLIRLHNQQLVNPKFQTAAEVVSWLGAVQAQDYLQSLWGIGQRLNQTTEPEIEKAIVSKSIVRTWPMRGTLHFVPWQEVSWMLKYLTPRVVKRQGALFRKAELDQSVFSKCRKVVTKALQGGQVLTRENLYEVLEQNKISVANMRGLHITFVLAQEQLICLGPRQGKQHTFTLLDEWLPPSKEVSFDEGLSKLALTYFRSHGPATVQDFAWWAGLTQAESKAALETIRPKLVSEVMADKIYWFSPDIPKEKNIPGVAHFVSVYDEYGIAYKDRSMFVDEAQAEKLKGRDFLNMVMIKGRIGGMWKRTMAKDTVRVDVSPLTRFSPSEKKYLETAVKKYGRFLRLTSELHIK